jgi:hypothetical protein
MFRPNIFFIPVWSIHQIPGHGLPWGGLRSYSLDTPYSVGLLGRSDQTDAEISTWHFTQQSQETNIHSLAGFQPIIRASGQQRAQVCSKAGIGQPKLNYLIYIETCYSVKQTLCVTDSCDLIDTGCINSLHFVRYNYRTLRLFWLFGEVLEQIQCTTKYKNQNGQHLKKLLAEFF